VQLLFLTWIGDLYCGFKINSSLCDLSSDRGIILRPLLEGRFLMSERKIRVLVAKPGLDGHDRGAKVVARALRDAGMEVIYTGLRQTPEMIAESALQEDVDIVGLSILSGAHMALVPRVLELLKANGQDQVKVFLGGIIPDEDVLKLRELGVFGIYGPGTLTDDIVQDVRSAVFGKSVQST
jgi:methylmalonyl-CoA mutase C-terminal domain/subunit